MFSEDWYETLVLSLDFNDRRCKVIESVVCKAKKKNPKKHVNYIIKHCTKYTNNLQCQSLGLTSAFIFEVREEDKLLREDKQP